MSFLCVFVCIYMCMSVQAFVYLQKIYALLMSSLCELMSLCVVPVPDAEHRGHELLPRVCAFFVSGMNMRVSCDLVLDASCIVFTETVYA